MDYTSRFTEGARTALNRAAEAAGQLGHKYVGTEHLLLGLLMEGGSAAELLNNYVDVKSLTERIMNVGGRASNLSRQMAYTPLPIKFPPF